MKQSIKTGGKAEVRKAPTLSREESTHRLRQLSRECDAHGVAYYKHEYSLLLPVELSLRELELYCYKVGWPKTQGGLGRYQHFRNATKIMWPELQWNPWLEAQIKSLCDDRYAVQNRGNIYRNVSWAGCATAGKTFGAGLFAMVWWLADPLNSIAILTSTTKDMIRRRVWPVIQNFCHTAVDGDAAHRVNCGHLLESRTALQAIKGDDKHSIFAIAVRDGETSKAVENIKGQHAPRILIVIDEATGTPEAIFETLPNLRKSCQDFTVLTIGNPVSKMDPHGRVCEPAKGWDSVSIDDNHWRTKPQPQWQLEGGICLHFDGEKSPNVTLGETIFPYIYTCEDHDASLRNHDANSIHFWAMDRGFWPPDGSVNTVLSQTLIEKFDARGEHTFASPPSPIAALDPAFGGDGCILQFGQMGRLADGRTAIQVEEFLELQPSALSRDEVDYQIARRTIDECIKRRVAPTMFGMDATGIGRGVYAIISNEWSASAHRVEFGGKPSDRSAGPEDRRPAHDVYDRKVTELWYSVREFVSSGLLKGLAIEACAQFCSREYVIRSRKLALDTKEDCKRKLGRSPDHADAVSVLVEVAKRMGAVPKGGRGARRNQAWSEFVDKSNAIYQPIYDLSPA